MYITLVAQTVKNLPGSIPESGRSPGEGTGHPLQYPCQENPRDWGTYSPWGRRVGHDRGFNIMADSLHHTAETNTTLGSNYIPIKK